MGEAIAQRSVGGLLGTMIRDAATCRILPPPSASPTPPLKGEAQLKPVAETLAKCEAQVTAVEKARAEETGGLKAQIAALMEASTATQFEARKLSAALRRGAGVQGRWGEQTLRNVLEAAGLNS